MSFCVLVCTHGDDSWVDLARERALPSAAAAEPEEIVALHSPDGGLAHARNCAASSARASHLIFLDADDELDPGYVDAMRTALAMLAAAPMPGSPGQLDLHPTLFVPRVQRVWPDGREDAPRFPNRQLPMDRLNHCVIGTAVPRLLFLSLGGFRADLPIYEDWALFLACLRAGAVMADVAAAVYRAHERDGGGRNANRRVAAATYEAIRSEHLAATGAA